MPQRSKCPLSIKTSDRCSLNLPWAVLPADSVYLLGHPITELHVLPDHTQSRAKSGFLGPAPEPPQKPSPLPFLTPSAQMALGRPGCLAWFSEVHSFWWSWGRGDIRLLFIPLISLRL